MQGYPISDFTTEKIGSGSLGDVFKATHNKSRALLTAKTLLYNRFKEGKEEEFFQQIRRIQELKDFLIPQLFVNYVDFSTKIEKGTDLIQPSILFMEYCHYDSLEKIITQRIQISFTHKIRILFGVACAFDILHEHNLYHLNLKPSNIMLDEIYSPRLTDYGIYQFVSQHNPTSSRYWPEYFNPQDLIMQIRCDPVLMQFVDIYSFGVLIFEVFTGEQWDDRDNGGEYLSNFAPPYFSDLFQRCLGMKTSEQGISFKIIRSEMLKFIVSSNVDYNEWIYYMLGFCININDFTPIGLKVPRHRFFMDILVNIKPEEWKNDNTNLMFFDVALYQINQNVAEVPVWVEAKITNTTLIQPIRFYDFYKRSGRVLFNFTPGDLLAYYYQPLTLVELLSFIYACFDTLRCIHQKGFVVNTISLWSVMIDHNKMPKFIYYFLMTKNKSHCPNPPEQFRNTLSFNIDQPTEMAPELFLTNPISTTQSDIYSMAYIIIQLITHNDVFLSNDYDMLMKRKTQEHQEMEKNMYKLLDSSENSSHCIIPKLLIAVLLKCVQSNPEERLTAEEVCKVTQEIAEDIEKKFISSITISSFKKMKEQLKNYDNSYKTQHIEWKQLMELGFKGNLSMLIYYVMCNIKAQNTISQNDLTLLRTFLAMNPINNPRMDYIKNEVAGIINTRKQTTKSIPEQDGQRYM